jgi:serine/threonine protein phosphatase PrpC
LINSSFYCFGKSVRGRDHRLSGLPNQDAIRIYIGKDNNPAIIALADGHGSPVHFRSELGSKMAVDTAVDVLSSLSEIDMKVHTKVSKYPTLITREWNARVLHDHKNKKFTSNELSALYQEVKNESFMDSIRLDPKISYGTTLIVLASYGDFMLYLQIGDGDILVVDDTGSVRKPLRDDVQFSRYQTKSLCTDGASDDFRIAVEKNNEANPMLMLASTDGYSNSFKSHQEYFEVGIAYRDLIKILGCDFLEDTLEDMLCKTSLQGSGDDITVGLACRSDLASDHGFIFP